ncbi:MAG: acetyl-CoA carboxylase, carboxyltransferase subunit beta [Rhodomicrobiaceae bacterium]
MNWINNVVRPKIRGLWQKREVPDNLWVKCPETGQMVFYKDVEANQLVIPGSNFHLRMGGEARLKSFFDQGEFIRIPSPEVPLDPLKFRDEKRYVDRLKDAKAKTSMDDAVIGGYGALDGQDVTAAVQDFAFMGGSLGMAAGETIIASMLKAVELETPFVLFAASGGARMQEGMFSLMQMPRTTVAVQKLREARLPYLVVLTHPTTGGVTASYAMLGDVHLAEPGALICFAGPRVIEQTIREKLPEGFQRAEYLMEHGMVDMVVHRHQLRETLSRLCSLLMERRELKRRVQPRKPAAESAVASKPMPPAEPPRVVVDNPAYTPDETAPEPTEDTKDSTALTVQPPEKAAAE